MGSSLQKRLRLWLILPCMKRMNLIWELEIWHNVRCDTLLGCNKQLSPLSPIVQKIERSLWRRGMEMLKSLSSSSSLLHNHNDVSTLMRNRISKLFSAKICPMSSFFEDLFFDSCQCHATCSTPSFLCRRLTKILRPLLGQLSSFRCSRVPSHNMDLFS